MIIMTHIYMHFIRIEISANRLKIICRPMREIKHVHSNRLPVTKEGRSTDFAVT